MTDTPANTPAFPPRPATLRQLELLGELAELGLEIARAIERQATGRAEANLVKGDFALAYARVSRSVRQTILLQTRLIDSMKAEDDAAAKAQPEADQLAARLTPEHQRKSSVERIVERVIEAEHPDDEEELETLMTEACERLDDEDLYGDLMDHPISELVARICHDLGLNPDWPALAAELWAVREMESGEVGAPLAALPPTASSPVQRGVEPIVYDRHRRSEGPEGAFGSDTG
jgi:hypothetical protein